MLSQYQSAFPEYTDHSTLQAPEIIGSCNKLIGDQVDLLTALPYLAALIRLVDELDIAADRNSAFLYDLMLIKNDISRLGFLKHQCIRSVEIQPAIILIKAASDDPRICVGGMDAVSKLEAVLRDCRKVVSEQTAFVIQQRRIVLNLNSSLRPL